MKSKKLYVAGLVEKTKDINVLGRIEKLDLTWADRMVGVCPVFETKAAALKYGGKKLHLIEVKSK